ncbi:MAG: exodeoxyribonuclease VII large subunit [Methanosarcinales archaeon]|nr:exodeoxyribonuclease VII large subunit [Methanosarcinales archaeon]
MSLLDFQSGPDKTEIYSVGELNHYIHDKINSDPQLRNIWVKGEISNLTNHSSGHKYFTLKDSRSQLNCVMFRNYCQNLDFKPEAGMKLLVFGNIDVYEVRGNYQLIVTLIRPEGVGELHIALEVLKRKLHSQGLFDADHKQPLPQFPRRIGVVTSPTGAVIQDIINVTRRRFPVDILLSPTVVQGEKAQYSIVRSIERLNTKEIDVIILARGGGSLEDLLPFNSEPVARAIYRSLVPVVSAVGHETDLTIADLTADVRAPTPSAAAELVVPDKEEVLIRIQGDKLRLITAIRNQIKTQITHLLHLENRIDARRVISVLDQYMLRVDELTFRLRQTINRDIEENTKRLGSCMSRLNAISPLNTLKRGYSIVLHNGEVIRSIRQIKKGDALEMRMIDGRIFARVDRTEEDV